MRTLNGVCINGRCLYGFVVGRFPGRTESFIWREILELRKAFPDLVVYSLEKGGAGQIAGAEGKDLSRVRHTVLGGGWRACWWIARHPLRLWRLTEAAWKLSGVSGLRLGRLAWGGVKLAARADSDGVTHLHGYFANHISTVTYLAARALSLTHSVSAHAHDIWVETAPAEVLEQAACCLVCTEAGRVELERRYPGIQCDLVRHGVTLDEKRQRRCGTEKEPSSVLRMVTGARFVPKKGLEVLIEACSELRRREVPFVCSCYGDGPLKESLRRRVEVLGLTGQISIGPFLPLSELGEQLAESDLCVLPCRVDETTQDQDGVPNILLEAMGAGAVVVTSDLPQLRELVSDGMTGYLAPPDDPQALAEVLIRAWKEKGRWPQLREAAYEQLRAAYNSRRNGSKLREKLEEAASRLSGPETHI